MAEDDWRIRIEVEEEEHAAGLLERLAGELGSEARELAEELKERRLAVSRDDDTLFVYADTRTEAEQAYKVIEAELAESRIQARTRRARWPPGSTARSSPAASWSTRRAAPTPSPSSAGSVASPTLTDPAGRVFFPLRRSHRGISRAQRISSLEWQHRSVLRRCKKRSSSRPAHWRRQTR